MAETLKTTVSRTSSAGNASGTTVHVLPESPGFPFARRHSSAGILAFKWTTTRSSSLVLENRGSKDSVLNIVVTPDSIPQFTIPKLALENGFRGKGNMKGRQVGEEEEDWGSTLDVSSCHRRLCLSSSVSSSSSTSCISPVPGKRGFSDIKHSLEVEHCSDPASEAALSLPHLAKLTTPYGFVTLSESPQMANEEALFFQGHRRLGCYDDNAPKGIRSIKTSPTQMPASTPPHQSPIINRFFRSHSITGTQLQKQLAETKSNQLPKPTPVSKSKRKLWAILRNKHERKTFDFEG